MQDKREALLNSALELFSTRGYQNTPTSLISKNAGVATGTLFHHFSSKEELINQLYLDCKMKILAAITGRLTEGLSAEEKISAVWNGMISWALANENRYLFIFQHQNAALIRRETREEAESLFSPLLDLIREAIDTKLIRPMPEEMLMSLIGSLLMGTVTYFLEHKNHFEKREYRENAYLIFLNALKQ